MSPSPLVTAAISAFTTITTIGGFLIAHRSAIKKEYLMIRQQIQDFVTAVQTFESAVTARLAQPAPLTAEETAALATAQAQVQAATAAVSSPAVPQ